MIDAESENFVTRDCRLCGTSVVMFKDETVCYNCRGPWSDGIYRLLDRIERNERDIKELKSWVKARVEVK